MNHFNRILVLAAMQEEEQSIRNTLNQYPHEEIEVGKVIKTKVCEFKIGKREVLVAQSGMGPVNAALTLATLIEKKTIDAVILLGVGGALSPHLKIGDVVVSKKVLQHDYYSSLDFGNPRMAPGHIVFNEEQALKHSPCITADPELITLIQTAIPKEHLLLGTVVSGNEFVGTVKRKLDLQAMDPEALLVDMEAAGVAQVAARIALPFVVVKTVADRLNTDGSIEADFRACLEAAARNAAVILHRILE